MSKRIAIATAIAACLILTSCSRLFWMVASGSVASGIEVAFFEGRDQESHSRLPIVELTVSEWNSGSPSSPLWSLRGRASVASIRYGDAPPGLEELGPAEPMKPGAVYVALARDGPRLRVPGGAVELFAITPDGNVASCESLADCKAATGG